MEALDCAVCWWNIEPEGGGWKHSIDRAELGEDDWMCRTPSPGHAPQSVASDDSGASS